jgi:hypothetical protein
MAIVWPSMRIEEILNLACGRIPAGRVDKPVKVSRWEDKILKIHETEQLKCHGFRSELNAF